VQAVRKLRIVEDAANPSSFNIAVSGQAMREAGEAAFDSNTLINGDASKPKSEDQEDHIPRQMT